VHFRCACGTPGNYSRFGMDERLMATIHINRWWDKGRLMVISEFRLAMHLIRVRIATN